MSRARHLCAAVAVASALLTTACGAGAPTADPAPSASPAASSSPEPTTGPSSEPSTEPRPAPGSVPPPWLGTRVLPEGPDGFGEVRPTPPALRTRAFTLPDTIAPLPGPGFASRVVDPVPARVLERSTWEPGCPVAADDLAWVRVTFVGFDDARHTGELLVASVWADDLVGVFRTLWRARFPLEELRITRADELHVPPTGDGNGSGAFVCRAVTGGTSYSEHAYGRAIDLNPFQNPYRRGDVVVPELASAYLDRSRDAPGMIRPDGVVVRAFAAIGWRWGGDYTSLEDYQHFSSTGG
ncbi:M15 family metallopeptidase [Nocardioides lentus]|uniref:M15 family metallopeptidase n=1 Tax=Nocardioides lentus TaxID=338077 RepID=UPI0031D2DBA7